MANEVGGWVGCLGKLQSTHQGSQSASRPQKGNSSAVQVNWGEPRHSLPASAMRTPSRRQAARQAQAQAGRQTGRASAT